MLTTAPRDTRCSMGSNGGSEGEYDGILSKIMKQEHDNIPAFLDVVFSFLSRHHAEEVFGGGGGGGGSGGRISGEHLVSQSFCRWRRKYQEQRAEKEMRQHMHKCGIGVDENVPEAVVEEVVSTHTKEEVEEEEEEVDARLSNTAQKPATPDHTKGGRVSQGCSSSRSSGYLDTTNGAVMDSLAWTQSIEDLEVRLAVPPSVKKGKQVSVTVKQTSILVALQGVTVPGCHILLEGTLPYPVKAEESLWSLLPAEYVTINLEKCEERWWDRLLTRHDPIDLQKINAERDYGSLPEEDRSKIQELMWSKLQEEQGRPTPDQMRMESVLKKAWSAEGSPFLGQPFDPSTLNIIGSHHDLKPN